MMDLGFSPGLSLARTGRKPGQDYDGDSGQPGNTSHHSAALPPLTALLLAYLLFSILLSFQIKNQAVLVFPLFITDVSTSVGEFGVS